MPSRGREGTSRIRAHRRISVALWLRHRPQGRRWGAAEALLQINFDRATGEDPDVRAYARLFQRSRTWVQARINEYDQHQGDLKEANPGRAPTAVGTPEGPARSQGGASERPAGTSESVASARTCAGARGRERPARSQGGASERPLLKIRSEQNEEEERSQAHSEFRLSQPEADTDGRRARKIPLPPGFPDAGFRQALEKEFPELIVPLGVQDFLLYVEREDPTYKGIKGWRAALRGSLTRDIGRGLYLKSRKRTSLRAVSGAGTSGGRSDRWTRERGTS